MMDYSYGIVTTDKPQANGHITTDALPDRPKMRQVAEWLGVNYSTARRMALEGAIPCKKIQRRKQIAYLFDKSALLEWARPEGGGMNRLDTIRQRLAKYISADTSTDEKLEIGAIADWVAESDDDTSWLLARVDELVEALWAILYADQDNQIDKELFKQAKAVLDKAKGLD